MVVVRKGKQNVAFRFDHFEYIDIYIYVCDFDLLIIVFCSQSVFFLKNKTKKKTKQTLSLSLNILYIGTNNVHNSYVESQKEFYQQNQRGNLSLP